jgi:hypothetical protein
VVKLSNEFSSAGTQILDGIVYHEYHAGSATVLIGDATVQPSGGALPSNIDLASFSASQGYKVDVDLPGVNTWVRPLDDVNGDGVDDVLVTDFAGTSPRQWVVFGTVNQPLADFAEADLNGAQGFKIVNLSENPANLLSSQIGKAGDVNGDGIDDLALVGNTGAFILSGHTGAFPTSIDAANLAAADGLRLIGNITGVSAVGDINGDGYDDLIVAAQDPNVGTNADLYVVFGHQNGVNTSINLSMLDGSTGFRLDIPDAEIIKQPDMSAGDINGDGYADIIISGWSDRDFVLFGHGGSYSSTVTATPDGFGLTEFIVGYDSGRVSSAGDVNGDGLDDLVFTSWTKGLTGGGTQDGAAFVVFGTTAGFGPQFHLDSLDGKNGFRLDGPTDSATGVGVSSGDFNGDGYSDLLLVGGSTGPGNGTHPGASYLFYGHGGEFAQAFDLDNLNGLNGIQIIAPSIQLAQAEFAGDINQDGFDDITVVVRPAGAGPAATNYVLYGGEFRAEATLLGDGNANNLTGTAGADLIAGGDGNDVIHGAGGRDSLQGGGGNDELHVADGGFFRVDGGSGTDTLHLDFGGAIDLGNLDGNAATSDRGKISEIEVIDVDNGANNAVSLHLADLLDIDVQNSNVGGVATLDNVLKVDGNAGDTLQLFASEGWSTADTSALSGYAVYTHQNVKVAVDTDIVVSVN